MQCITLKNLLLVQFSNWVSLLRFFIFIFFVLTFSNKHRSILAIVIETSDRSLFGIWSKTKTNFLSIGWHFRGRCSKQKLKSKKKNVVFEKSIIKNQTNSIENIWWFTKQKAKKGFCSKCQNLKICEDPKKKKNRASERINCWKLQLFIRFVGLQPLQQDRHVFQSELCFSFLLLFDSSFPDLDCFGLIVLDLEHLHF